MGTRDSADPARPHAKADGADTAVEGDADKEARGVELLISSAAGVEIVPLKPFASYVIGRDQSAEIVVSDRSISRKHARLRFDWALTLADLGSINGTSMGGRRLPPHEEIPIDVGAVFELGSVTLLIQRARRPSDSRKGPVEGAADRDFVAQGTEMQRLDAMLTTVAPTPLSILILGETGVGKEVFATRAHELSTRADKSFLKLNCAALPESMLEAELFGYERGAFTGAVAAKPGLFESAHEGTVFLDEIGEMPPSMQAKLLRVLESREVRRLGSLSPRTVDVRFIAATHRDLERACAEGAFRQDLYFRINGMTFALPPLRDRPSEILPLAEAFAERLSRTLGRPTPTIDPAAGRLLTEQRWAGNIRELRNVIERAVILCPPGRPLTPDLFHLDAKRQASGVTPGETSLRGSPDSTNGASAPAASAVSDAGHAASGSRAEALKHELKELERTRVTAALDECGGNQTLAARKLGISRSALIARIESFGLVRPRRRDPRTP